MTDDAEKMMRYDAQKRSTGAAYLIWFFLGGLGAHRFYFRKNVSGAIILALVLLSPFTFFISLGVVAIWVLVDAFLIPGWIEEFNSGVADSLS